MPLLKTRRSTLAGLLCAATCLGGISLDVAVADPLYPDQIDPDSFHPGYYAFLPDHEPIYSKVLLNNDLVGLKVTYRWRNLEPAQGVYDFSAIQEDLATLQAAGKRLWIQIEYM